jgi:apolipoprotein N-acyltransferase
MEALGLAVVEMAVAVLAAALAFRALCAAPLATLAAVALLALAIQEGAVEVPQSQLATRIDAAQAEVHRWQDDTATGISCRVAVLRDAGAAALPRECVRP